MTLVRALSFAFIVGGLMTAGLLLVATWREIVRDMRDFEDEWLSEERRRWRP